LEGSLKQSFDEENPVEALMVWATKYSPGVLALLIVATAAVYVLKLLTEKVVANQFELYTKQTELRLKNRSDFEQRILVDQYELVSDLAERLGRIATDLNRNRSGTSVEGLFRDGDIVPLTEVFELLTSKRYLLKQRFYEIFWNQAQTILSSANSNDKDELGRLEAQYMRNLESLYETMNEVFGIERISW
jgi:hypothetical protein